MNETMLILNAAANAGNGAAFVTSMETLACVAGIAVVAVVLGIAALFFIWDFLAEQFGKLEDEYDMYYPPKEDKTKEINNKEGNDK